MPIRREFRKYYSRVWRTVTRPRILARARNKCELCRVPNRTKVFRARGAWWRLVDSGAPWHLDDGRVTTFEPAETRTVTIVLTVAHLNHIPGDDRDENLKALCQWCHLDYDKHHHHETRATRKDSARPLLRELPGS